MNKSILFVINGFGMGNATRCDAFAHLLDPEISIDIITSDKAYEYFKNHPRYSSVYNQINIKQNKKMKYGTLLFFINYTFLFMVRLFKNYYLQKKIITKNNYDFIVFDSDYSFILHKLLSPKLKIIGLNNSFEIVYFFKKNYRLIQLSVLASLIIEVLDFCVYKMFTHFTIAPCFNYKKWQTEINCSQLIISKKLLIVPLLVRKSLIQMPTQIKNDSLLVMASSSNVDSDLDKIIPKIENKNLILLVNQFNKNNTEQLCSASALVCNAGQSSLAEALYLKKPTLAVPIPHHAEQMANALMAGQFGITYYRNNNNIKLDIQLNTPPFYNVTFEELSESIKETYKKLSAKLY